MELTAVIFALERARGILLDTDDAQLQGRDSPCVVVHTDSKYVQRAFADGWLRKWRSNGWKTAARRDVANRDLWSKLSELTDAFPVSIDWRWVKGHAGCSENEVCDQLASEALVGKLAVDKWDEPR
jgi:ribonuclease HI